MSEQPRKRKRKLTPLELASIKARAHIYVEAQLDIMRANGSCPVLTQAQYFELVEKCAAPIREVESFRPIPAKRGAR